MPRIPLSLLLLLGYSSLGAAAWATGSVNLVVVLSSEAPRSEISGSVTLLTEGQAPLSYPLSSWDSLTMAIPDRVPTRIRVHAEGFWVAEEIVLPTGTPLEEDLQLHPAGTLEGSLVPPRGEPLPTSLSVTLEPAQPFRVQRPTETHEPGHFPRTTQNCPVDSKGRWTCPAPAGRLDLRLRVDGYVSEYRWGTQLSAGESLDLGRLLLRPGASVVGWVRTADQSPLRPDARALLTPITAGSQLAAEAAGVDRRSESTAVDGRGFFHFEGVAPGSYTLRVEHPGFAAAEFSPLTVLEGRETNLPGPLVLDFPVRFEVALIPPVDPYGRPWRLSLDPQRAGTGSKPEPAGTDGLWVRAGLAPGSYRLTVESGQGRYDYTWWSEEVSIEAGMPIYELRLPVVEVVGSVRLGEEPLEAMVRFGGRFGGRRLDFGSDEEGRFGGYLPEAGEWPVSVYSEETGWRNLSPIPVDLLPGERLAKVNIRIPDLTIRGEVVDAEGQPVPDAIVWAHPLDFERARGRETERTTSDEHGEFRLRGLEAASWLVSAQLVGSEATSNAVAVELSAKEPPSLVRLTLERWVEVEARLLSAAGPVAGARVEVAPRMPGEFLMFSRPTLISDATGRVRFTYPQRAAGVDLSVLAPGFAAQAQFLPSPLPELIVIQVVQEGGTLILDLRSFVPSLHNGELPPSLLFHEDARLSLATARRWARLQRTQAAPDGKLLIPMMAPGSYTLCVSMSAGDEPKKCARGVLPPYGQLELGLD